MRGIIARTHATGAQVTVALMMAELASNDSTSAFFQNDRATRRWLSSRGIIWRRSDPYEYAKSRPDAVRKRGAFLMRLAQNRCVLSNVALLFIVVFCCVLVCNHDVVSCKRCIWMRRIFGGMLPAPTRGSRSMNRLQRSRLTHPRVRVGP